MEIQSSAASQGSTSYVDKVKLKDSFLKLLMAQMKYSDPLEPPDNLGFLSQLSSLATVEQIAEVNSKLDRFESPSKLINNSNIENLNLLSHYIGRRIEAVSDKIDVNDCYGIGFYNLKVPANKVTIKLMKDGEVVYTNDIKNQASGFHNFEIFSLDDGKYEVDISAYDSKGKKLDVENVISGRVDSVNLLGNKAVFVVDGLDVDPLNMVSVKLGKSCLVQT